MLGSITEIVVDLQVFVVDLQVTEFFLELRIRMSNSSLVAFFYKLKAFVLNMFVLPFTHFIARFHTSSSCFSVIQWLQHEFPKAVSNSSTNKTLASGIHHPHPPLDLCTVLQGKLGWPTLVICHSS